MLHVLQCLFGNAVGGLEVCLRCGGYGAFPSRTVTSTFDRRGRRAFPRRAAFRRRAAQDPAGGVANVDVDCVVCAVHDDVDERDMGRPLRDKRTDRHHATIACMR